MGFYDLDKTERDQFIIAIHDSLLNTIRSNQQTTPIYFSDEDTYIRKTAYLAVGRIYKQYPDLRERILKLLDLYYKSSNEKVRQTTINAAGEIGMIWFEPVEHFFDTGLFDVHHIVRNAVIGSVKKMGAKNQEPVLLWAKKYLHHPDKEVRREICHGIELRGRTHPQDILPLLKELQFDQTARVRNTLVHVIGQIAYKKGCLEMVIEDLNNWENKELVRKAIDEIIDVHDRYKDFAILTQQEATAYIDQHFIS
jgi:hypothetical protein